MSLEILPTVRVIVKETKNEVTINEADFDESLHELFVEKPVKQSKASKAEAPKFTIVAKNDKFAIVDADGAQQGELFDTEEAAKTMLAVIGA